MTNAGASSRRSPRSPPARRRGGRAPDLRSSRPVARVSPRLSARFHCTGGKSTTAPKVRNLTPAPPGTNVRARAADGARGEMQRFLMLTAALACALAAAAPARAAEPTPDAVIVKLAPSERAQLRARTGVVAAGRIPGL